MQAYGVQENNPVTEWRLAWRNRVAMNSPRYRAAPHEMGLAGLVRRRSVARRVHRRAALLVTALIFKNSLACQSTQSDEVQEINPTTAPGGLSNLPVDLAIHREQQIM